MIKDRKMGESLSKKSSQMYIEAVFWKFVGFGQIGRIKENEKAG